MILKIFPFIAQDTRSPPESISGDPDTDENDVQSMTEIALSGGNKGKRGAGGPLHMVFKARDDFVDKSCCDFLSAEQLKT